MAHRWWWGSSPPGAPDDAGVWVSDPGGGSARLAAQVAAPQWLVTHPDVPVLYVVHGPFGDGGVTALDISHPEDVHVLGHIPIEGAPSHAVLSRDGLSLYVSTGAGGLAHIRVAADGLFASHRAITVSPRRDDSLTRAGTLATPEGRFLLAWDSGSDDIRCYDILPDGALRPDRAAAHLPARSAPIAASCVDGFVHVLCEGEATVHSCEWDVATRSCIPRSVTTVSADVAGAHLMVAASQLYVSIPSHRSVAVFDREGEVLRRRTVFSAQGAFPGRVAVIDEWFVMCDESGTGEVCDVAEVLALDKDTDLPEERDGPQALDSRPVDIPSPTCVRAV